MDGSQILTIEKLFSVPAKKLRYVLLKNEDRKVIHQFLEANYPKLKRRSVFCKKFEIECQKVYRKCYYCKKPVLMEYHYGYMENNYDESYSGDCRKCEGLQNDNDADGFEGHVSWEPNDGDDDGVFKVPIHMKMLVFGDYQYDERKYGTTENKRIDNKTFVKTDLIDILKDRTIYEIDVPKDPSLTNTQLAWYIYWSLNFEQQGKNNSPKSTLISITN